MKPIRLYIPQGRFADVSNIATGAAISQYNQIQELSNHAELYISGREEKQIAPNIHTVKFDASTLAGMKRWYAKYDGILMFEPDVNWMLDYRNIADVPIVIRLYSVRGMGSRFINKAIGCYSLLRDFDALSPKSMWCKDYLKQFGLNETYIKPIPNGVNSELFSPQNKMEAKKQVYKRLGDERILSQPIIGFVSRFQPEKGAVPFLKCAQMNPEYLFLAVGPVFTDYSRLVGENVIFAGHQPQSDLPVFYNSLDILCFPSVAGVESCSSVLLEGMACGLPIVATDFNGVTELVDGVGVLVPILEYDHDIGGLVGYVDASELTLAIKELMHDASKRQRYAEAARARALEFSWNNVSKQLIELFHELSERRKNSLRQHSLFVSFTMSYDRTTGSNQVSSLILNNAHLRKGPLNPSRFASYDVSPLEGIALILLQQMSIPQTQTALLGIVDDHKKVEEILCKLSRFLEMLPPPSKNGKEVETTSLNDE